MNHQKVKKGKNIGKGLEKIGRKQKKRLEIVIFLK